MSASSQYDEFQAMLEQQKGIYLQQNSQLAKYNSSLMMKITDMETKVSELVQENVSLRSRLSMGELRYREKLNTVFQTLEDGIVEKFLQMNQLLTTVRESQGLESGIHDNPLKPILRGSNGISPRSAKKVEFTGANTTTKPVGFEDPIAEDNHENSGNSLELNDDEVRPLRKRRRKSSRRESLFIPADFEFNDEDPELELNQLPITEDEPPPSTAATSVPEEESQENKHTKEEREDEGKENVSTIPLVPVLPSVTNTGTECSNTNKNNTTEMETALAEDDSYNFTTSVIEYSIPEETSTHEHSHILLETSKSKIDVYNDREETNNNEADDSMNIVQCTIPSQSKIKHSMKHPRTKLKGGQDDIMPHTDYDKDDEKRERRTRGKAVNYKLPSLRAKMRRPTEKLVDATTVTDIHDLQVKRRNNQQQGIPSDDDDQEELLVPAGVPDTNVVIATVEEENRKEPPALPLHEIHLAQNVKPKIALKELSANAINRKVKTSTAVKAISHTKLRVLKDVKFNTLPTKQQAIENNSSDPNVSDENENSNVKPTRTKQATSDLAAFEIIDGISLKHVSRTHRVRAKEDMNKKRKRIHNDEISI